MTQPEHTPTEQETVLYDHMTAGEWDAIETMRSETEDAEAFEADHAHAHAHYQADHEAPQAAREEATEAQVADENQAAG